jgi:hypothetical protein
MKRMTERSVTLAIGALLLAGILVPVGPRPVLAQADLSGTYYSDDGSIYYLQQKGNTLWWAGLSLDPGLNVDQIWHRGVDSTNVFRGTIVNNVTVVGDWTDVTRGATLNSGTLLLAIGVTSSGTGWQLTRISESGGFRASVLTQSIPIDDRTFNGTKTTILSRFDQVLKNNGDGSSTLHDNLKPYRDETVVFGLVISQNGNSDTINNEAPHVNFPLGGKRDYVSFQCVPGGAGDADLDFRLLMDRSRLEQNFWTTGWGDRDPGVILQKFTDPAAQAFNGWPDNQNYIGAEGVMYARTAACSHSPGASTGPTLLPGWAESGGNSILLNGRPLDGVDALIQQGGNGLNINGQSLEEGAYVRVTGALSLDCGHYDDFNSYHDTRDGSLTTDDGDTCFEYEGFGSDFFAEDLVNAEHSRDEQNQEIHPIYSIDIIRPPLGPNPDKARMNLTGTWGSSDGGTYYVRQIGNNISWLGLSRDKVPLQPGTGSAPIPQTANVFYGTITENFDGSASIHGDYVYLPQSINAGSPGGTITFNLNANRKLFTPSAPLTGAFPAEFDKLYEPTDTVPPQSTLVIGSPEFSTGGSQPFVTSSTPLNLSATDIGSGVQTVWYRSFPVGTVNPPPYQAVNANSATFQLAGADGPYEVDTFATDAAGNDEAVHVQNVYLDNTPPAITIAQPTASQYVHSATLTLNYAVSDGAGSGVQSFTSLMDNATTLAGHVLQNGQAVNLLTELTLGPHTFTINAVDNLANATTAAVSFTIIATPDSIKDDVREFRANDAIKNQPLANSLIRELDAAATAYARGNCSVASYFYHEFIHMLQRQSGKGIDPTAAAIMIADAQYLIAGCPGNISAQSIKDDVREFRADGVIKNQRLANSLLRKLNAAATAHAHGNCIAANKLYRDFIRILQKERSKSVDIAAAAIMIADARYLIAHCP